VLRGKEAIMDSEPTGRSRSPSLSWRKALVFFVVVGVAGWVGIAALFYAGSRAWDIVAGSSDQRSPANVAPAAGPAPR
jgi:hypothetical protein